LITEQEVKDQLEILNNSKPSGPDGVAPRILRSVSQCLVSPLTLLFNQFQIVRPEMTKFKIFKEKIFILWELHSKILVGDKNLL
jgi:hypothetical protein